MTTNQSDQLLTPNQTSEILGVSTQTLAIWRCNKRYNLSYVKVGRYVRYRYADIQSFIDAQTVVA
jgi:predicted DNA-binding transcriptional regulator AlpA